jgi:hypothetical protein
MAFDVVRGDRRLKAAVELYESECIFVRYTTR